MSDERPFESEENARPDDDALAAEQPDPDVEELHAQLKRLREDLNSCAAALKSMAKNKSRALSDNARDLIDENPVPALLSTFAVGLVVGLVLQRPVRYYTLPPNVRQPRPFA